MKDFVVESREDRDGVPITARLSTQLGRGCRRSNLQGVSFTSYTRFRAM
jgi:hypothetical protein